MIRAINKKYQSTVNKAYRDYRIYHEEVNSESPRLIKQQMAFERYEEALSLLPAREVTNFNKVHKSLHGYT